MARPLSLGRDDVTLSLGGPSEYTPQPETPLRLAVLGDFRGRGAAADVAGLADRRPLRVDRDNFDEVMGKFGLALDLPLGGAKSPLTARFRELDDFHPDHLYQNLDVFRSLRDLRAELGDPSTF